ncbi:hypothetical protein LSTR_LSTR008129 [Laodelphax striatellus]|uniref:Odorant receptor n=1 Tax=Laodelphax striatellus TaxID=195883 RepID=A0A482XTI4_LAOST|nr:hypothetical protein LSTR_LSTR008129 [Laodelphax striatellus]
MTKLTDATNKLREVMSRCGSPEGRNRRFLAKFYVLLTMIFILGTMIDIFRMGEDEFEEKIFRFKSINILISGLTFPLVDRDTYRLITMIDDRDSSDLGIKLSKAQKSFQTEMDSKLDKINNQMYVVSVVIYTLLIFGPLLSAIILISTRFLSNAQVYITFEDLSLPINFWYPAEFENSFTYIFLYALQTFYMYHFSGYMYCTVAAGLMALKKAINEMKLLCLIVEDWDKEKITERKMEETINLKMEINIAADIRERLINVVKLHDSICRKVSSLNSSLEKMYTVFNNTICFQICICLYSSSKMDDLVLKIEHLMLMIPLSLITFLYCSIAQNLLNEGEKFRELLYWGSSFVDKPKWFRTSLLLIMTRTSKELEIRPYGFYVLNLRTFSMVLNAAYSYFNMLNSLKSRI